MVSDSGDLSIFVELDQHQIEELEQRLKDCITKAFDAAFGRSLAVLRGESAELDEVTREHTPAVLCEEHADLDDLGELRARPDSTAAALAELRNARSLPTPPRDPALLQPLVPLPPIQPMALEIEVLEDTTTAAAPADGALPAAAADESLKDGVYTAAAYGDLEKLQRLVEAEAASVADSDGNGYHALQWAALNNRVAAAQYSLEAHNDSNTATPSIEPKGTVLWPASWPSCIHVRATGVEARPRPWPSFDCYYHGRILLQPRLLPQVINIELSKCEPPVSSCCCATSCALPATCYCAETFYQPNAALICCYGKYLCFDTVCTAKRCEYLTWLLGIMVWNQLDILCSPMVTISFNSHKAMDHHYDSCHYGESLPLNSVDHISYPLIVASCVGETQMRSDVGPSILLRSEFVTGQHHSTDQAHVSLHILEKFLTKCLQLRSGVITVSVLLCSHNGVAPKYQNCFLQLVKNVEAEISSLSHEFSFGNHLFLGQSDAASLVIYFNKAPNQMLAEVPPGSWYFLRLNGAGDSGIFFCRNIFRSVLLFQSGDHSTYHIFSRLRTDPINFIPRIILQCNSLFANHDLHHLTAALVEQWDPGIHQLDISTALLQSGNISDHLVLSKTLTWNRSFSRSNAVFNLLIREVVQQAVHDIVFSELHVGEISHKVFTYIIESALLLTLDMYATGNWDPGILVAIMFHAQESGVTSNCCLEYAAVTQWDLSVLKFLTPNVQSQAAGINNHCFDSSIQRKSWYLLQDIERRNAIWLSLIETVGSSANGGVCIQSSCFCPFFVCTSDFETWKFKQMLQAAAVEYRCHAVQNFDQHLLVLRGIWTGVLESKLQYMTWDPHVQEIRPRCELAKQCYQWLSVGVNWRRLTEVAIAWGQAMFSGGGSVTPVHGYLLGQKYMSYGPTGLEFWTWSGVYKREQKPQSDTSKK